MKHSNPITLGLAIVCGFVVSSHADVIFSDTFGSGSTLDQTPTAPTSTSTSYENFSQGAAPTSTIASGNLALQLRSTASVFGEIGASFTTTPVALANLGDSVDLTIVFTDTANVLGGSAENTSAQLDIGLYNSGGTSLLTGTRLDAGSASTGGAAGYVGYVGRVFLNGNANFITRPAQSGGLLSSDQDLIFNNAGSGAFASPTGAALAATTATGFTSGLTVGNQYTLDYSITMTAAGTLTIANSLYSGTLVNPLNLLLTDTNTASGGTLLTSSFDTLGIGFRHTGVSSASTMGINSINVTDIVAAPEPATLALSAFGGLGLLAMRRFRNKK